ncbi:cell wall-binding repeat-containing protein [Desulfitobacterium sp.]|uniref:cell wall-binding repeat-containing protein n=1 Tax=Desulfitobacterium sp. TaxID=49981 RepID=UPI002C2F9220|nr:cell wall-binding repeat-containing protein [Desulfitobacterium sp.]HVJ50707.1 cell wall-binding repeat-containing protein [Desulfitobacterium sp.]
MKKLIGILTVLVLMLNIPTLTQANTSVTSSSTSVQVKRLYGQDRYQTATKIADEVALENGIDFSKGQKFKAVVLASGNDYPDAIAGAPLAQLYGGSILLVDRTPEESTTTWDYIRTHVNSEGQVFILGGKGVIPESFTNYLQSMGFNVGNIHQIGGKDRNETSLLIAKELLNPAQTAFLVSDSNFYDALTIASSAVSLNIPILLVSPSGLSPEQKSFSDFLTGVMSVGEIQKTIAVSYPKAVGFSGLK